MKSYLWILLIITSVIVLSCYVISSEKESASVEYVYDGDTFFINASKGDDKFRLARIDAPELDGSERLEGLESRDALRRLIQGKEIQYVNKGRGYYGRIIAEVYVNDTTNVSDWLVRNGYAVYKNY